MATTTWIPAFAGMTRLSRQPRIQWVAAFAGIHEAIRHPRESGVHVSDADTMDSHLRGNDACWPSLPRKRESIYLTSRRPGSDLGTP